MALDYNIIGERLKEARVNKKYTQENLAEKLDVSVAFLSKVAKRNAGLKNAFKSYFKREYTKINALDNISFKIHEGEMVRIYRS